MDVNISTSKYKLMHNKKIIWSDSQKGMQSRYMKKVWINSDY